MHVCRSKQGFFSFMGPYKAHLRQAILIPSNSYGMTASWAQEWKK